MALTLKSARNIIWDALKDYCLRIDPYSRPHEARHEILFSNKSQIRLMGADCSEKEMKKALGGKYKKVAIDEAGSFSIDLVKLVYQTLRPATADYLGQIIMLGTCENIRGTFFEKITEGREPGWSVHKWTAYDNPHMRDNWTQEVNDLIARNPLVVNASWFKTHYLNQWCADDDLIIIKINSDTITKEIPARTTPYNYILGVDLGYNDASAFVTVGYHDYDRIAYVVNAFKQSKMIISEVAKQIETLRTRYNYDKIVIDGANKQAVEEMRKRFGLPLESAQKTEKSFFLKLLSDDVTVGNVKVLESCKELIEEWSNLQWEDLNKEDEDPRCENHLCFPEGVLIMTEKGLVPIERVQLGDLIATPKGYRQVTHLMQGIYSGEWVKLLFSTGSAIECTGEHPFFTDQGMVPANALTYARRFCSLKTWESMAKQKSLNSMVKNTHDTPNRVMSASLDIFGSVVVRLICTVMFGCFSMVKSLGAIISITRMETPQITPLKILNLFARKNMRPAILKKIRSEAISRGPQLSGQSSLQKDGTNRTVGEGGIPHTQKKYGVAMLPSGKKRFYEHVLFAKKNSMLTRFQEEQKFVPTNAGQKSEEIAESTISKKYVNGAAANMCQTDTQNLDFAVYLVSHNTGTVSEKRIYNLTVENQHLYFANGILVSNSDGALYSWRECYHYLATREPIKNKIDSSEYMDELEQMEAENAKRHWFRKN